MAGSERDERRGSGGVSADSGSSGCAQQSQPFRGSTVVAAEAQWSGSEEAGRSSREGRHYKSSLYRNLADYKLPVCNDSLTPQSISAPRTSDPARKEASWKKARVLLVDEQRQRLYDPTHTVCQPASRSTTHDLHSLARRLSVSRVSACLNPACPRPPRLDDSQTSSRLLYWPPTTHTQPASSPATLPQPLAHTHSHAA